MPKPLVVANLASMVKIGYGSLDGSKECSGESCMGDGYMTELRDTVAIRIKIFEAGFLEVRGESKRQKTRSQLRLSHCKEMDLFLLGWLPCDRLCFNQ